MLLFTLLGVRRNIMLMFTLLGVNSNIIIIDYSRYIKLL